MNSTVFFVYGDEFIVIEVKAGLNPTKLGAKRVNQKNVEQGSRAYFDAIADLIPDDGLKEDLKKSLSSFKKDKVKYLFIQQPLSLDSVLKNMTIK